MKPVRPMKETDPRVIQRMHRMVDELGDLDMGDGLPLLRLPLPRARIVLVVGLQLYDGEDEDGGDEGGDGDTKDG